MLPNSITEYLYPYSIVQKRKSTVTNAFAQAEASSDKYNLENVIQALTELYGEEPVGDLKCVYCDRPAKTWDHLYGIVKNRAYSGYGHRIRNLVPCCKACNSSKGRQNWEEWLRSRAEQISNIEERIRRIRAYSQRLTADPESAVSRDLRERYTDVMNKVMNLLAEADGIAVEIRKSRQTDRADKSLNIEPESTAVRIDPADQISAPQFDDGKHHTNGNGPISKLTGERVIELIRQHPSLGYDQIARMVRAEIPGARTSAKSVASTVMHARKEGRLPRY
jgi:hypothetical protein